MANYIRCIHFSNGNGSKEGVIFTTDLEADVNQFIPYGCTLDNDFDTLKESDFPAGFPFEYTLIKE